MGFQPYSILVSATNRRYRMPDTKVIYGNKQSFKIKEMKPLYAHYAHTIINQDLRKVVFHIPNFF